LGNNYSLRIAKLISGWYDALKVPQLDKRCPDSTQPYHPTTVGALYLEAVKLWIIVTCFLKIINNFVSKIFSSSTSSNNP